MTTISSYALAAAPRLTVGQAQAALARAQIELSSGKLADIGLGLGAGSGAYVSLAAQGSRLQAIKDANAGTATTLTAATAGLDALRATASSFLASLTAAGSAGMAGGTLAVTAGANLDALTSTLNTTVGGDAIFAGIDTANPPMKPYVAADGTPSLAKQAVDAGFAGAFGTDPGSASASAISGDAMQTYLDGAFAGLFTADKFQGTWSTASDTPLSAQISLTETVTTSVTANADPFRQLAQAYTMVKEFGGTNFGAAAGKAVIASATALVSSALAGLTGAEAGLGTAQAAVSDADDRMTSQMAYLSGRSSDMVAVDPSVLSTQISGLQTQIQASFEITSELQQLSLVNYLK